MLKKISLIFVGLLTVFASTALVLAEESVPVSVFVSHTCPHCRAEVKFLMELEKERNDFEIQIYDLNKKDNYVLFGQFCEEEDLMKVTPITLVGNTVIQGFGSAETTGLGIIDLIDASRGHETFNFKQFLKMGGSVNIEPVPLMSMRNELVVNVPFYGLLDLSPYSLPALTMILGFIDGFNPCAMWVLVTFLIVLVQIGNRRRMWEIVGLFVIAEAVMYFLILDIWNSAWNVIGLSQWVTTAVGVLAVGGGVFFLYEGITSKGTCHVRNSQQRARTSSRIKKLAENPLTWVTAAGVVGLAFSVNIIEFVCSVGIVPTFTKILTLNSVSWVQEQMFILLYVLFYMVDDFVVFGVALWGIEHIGGIQKYSRYCNLIGGILMLALGFLLVFYPEKLVFAV